MSNYELVELISFLKRKKEYVNVQLKMGRLIINPWYNNKQLYMLIGCTKNDKLVLDHERN